MKRFQRYFMSLAVVLAAGAFGLATRAYALPDSTGVQPIWANYNVVVLPEIYNSLAGGHPIPSVDGTKQFRNFSGAINYDDGTCDSVPVGFPFMYNQNMYGSLTPNVSAVVNINVNGWVTIGTQPIPVTPANNNNLFSSVLPNNCVAPYYGDHFYRTTEPGYTPSLVSYTTTYVPASSVDPNSKPLAQIGTFVIEWKNLNINDKSNPNSIGTFQLIIRQNPKAYNLAAPDQRATIEFAYGPIGPLGNSGNVVTVGAAVGANDSVGFTHLNALFQSDVDPGDVDTNVTARTSCWPPVPGCLPGRVIQLQPVGVAELNQWGDGDVQLMQFNSPNPQVRANQSLFVTLEDAMLILQASSNDIPLDSIEGRAAFHGDANHDGRGYHDAQGVFHQNVINPNYGAYFYFTTPYDAAYIMMYLAGKLAELPWPMPLPVPGYKSADIHTTQVSGISANVSGIQTDGSTVLVPITLKGSVNGPLSLEMNLQGLASQGIEFVGARVPGGTICASNVKLGRLALATSGAFEDGQTLGYLELRVPANQDASFDLTGIKVNDAAVPPTHVALKFGTDGSAANVSTLDQNVPNPFVVSANGETSISFELAQPETVSIHVFDMLGHEVRTLIDGEGRAAGHNTVSWNGEDNAGHVVSSGLYYYQLVTPDFTKTVKMQVVR